MWSWEERAPGSGNSNSKGPGVELPLLHCSDRGRAGPHKPAGLRGGGWILDLGAGQSGGFCAGEIGDEFLFENTPLSPS